MNQHTRNVPRAADPTALSIGQIAALADVTRRAVRHYERSGLLPAPQRTEKGYRRYTMATVVRLIQIRRLRALGLGVAQIRATVADGATAGTLHESLRVLDEDLARRIETLQQMRRATQALLTGSGPSLQTAPAWRDLLRRARQTPVPPRRPGQGESGPGATLADMVELAEAVGGPPLVREMRLRLEDPHYLPRLQEVSRRLKELALLPSDQVAAESEALARALASELPLHLLPGPLADPAMLTILLGERLALVQVRCLERAWALAHAEARGEPYV
jgi:DNA-binding transcriptional MerR regulator